MAARPILHVSSVADKICIAFDTAVGRRYSLEVRSELWEGNWTPTGDTFQALNNGAIYFEKTVSTGQRFYRILVE